MLIRVGVTGALGRMGREVVRGVMADRTLELVAAIDPRQPGVDIGEVVHDRSLGLKVSRSLLEALEASPRMDVLIDFTVAAAAMENALAAVEAGIRPVVGTTGLPEERLRELLDRCRARRLGAVVVPNFSVGAALLEKLSADAARYLGRAEIVELHHDRKLDAPSGTAYRLAAALAAETGRPVSDYPIHSVRLPGLVAHHEVIFGGSGETLTLRHDSLSRESFIPGVLLAVKRVWCSETVYTRMMEILDS